MTGYGAQFMLGPREAAFLQNRPLSIVAAATGPDNVPAVTRCLGCRISADLGQITLFVPAGDGRELLTYIGNTGKVAVIFSLPSTHEAMQLKGTAAVSGKALEADFPLVDSYRQAFVTHLEELGYPRPTLETMLGCDHEDLVAIAFTPLEAFSQTPGPKAGQALGGTK